EGLFPPLSVSRHCQPVVDSPTDMRSRIAALVMASEEMGQHEVAATAGDRPLRTQDDGRIEPCRMAAHALEDSGPALAEHALVVQMGARPHPEVARLRL